MQLEKSIKLKGRELRFSIDNHSISSNDKEAWSLKWFGIGSYGGRRTGNFNGKQYSKRLKYQPYYGVGIYLLGIRCNIELFLSPRLGEKCEYCKNRILLLWIDGYEKVCYNCFVEMSNLLTKNSKK